jgi:ATP-dependent Clp protease ATP-binding subunit ClpA
MNGYNFTDRVRKVLQMAREEAARLNHNYVGTEHILLGLIREGEGVAVAVLTNLNVDLVDVQQRIEEKTKTGKPSAAAGPDLPYTSRAKKVLELSMAEARELRHSYVGSEHLLLGLLREEKGIAAQVLVEAEVTLESARTETLRLLRTDEVRPQSRGQPPHREGMTSAYNFTLELLPVLQGAREVANRLGADHVDAVHIALAILRMKDSAAGAVLTALNVDSIALGDNLESKVASRGVQQTEIRDLTYTGQAKNVIELAMVEARELSHREVGSEHLLLAVLREGVFDIPNAPLIEVRIKVAELWPNRAVQQRPRDSKLRLVMQSPTIRLVGGIVFVLSGAEALWYAPGFLGKALGLLGACGGLLIIEFWISDLRK